MSAVLQNGRWLDLNTRLEIDLELFIALSHLIHPSPLHRTHLPVTTSPQLRAAVLEAANIACTVRIVRIFEYRHVYLQVKCLL